MLACKVFLGRICRGSGLTVDIVHERVERRGIYLEGFVLV